MERFSRDFNVNVRSIGQLAVRNRKAYDRLQAGTAHESTGDRILEWIAAEKKKRMDA